MLKVCWWIHSETFQRVFQRLEAAQNLLLCKNSARIHHELRGAGSIEKGLDV
jgi:hypothetical protein